MKHNRKDSSTRSLISPSYWGMWLLIGLLWLLTRLLPITTNLWLGKKFGLLMYRLLQQRRHIVEINLQMCFPELTREQRCVLAKKVFESSGMGIIENGLAWWAKASALAKVSSIEGMEHYQTALASDRPIILCTAHFTTFEIAGRMVADQFTYHAIYRPQKNLAYNAVMTSARKKHLASIIDRNDVRAMMAALKAKVPLWIAPDQDYGKKRSIFVPFFGIQAAAITSVAKLARLSNAVVLPYYSYRKDGHYFIRFQPPLLDLPTGDLDKDTLRINQIIETGIRQCPEQYLWLHRRFKTRPKGEKGVY